MKWSATGNTDTANIVLFWPESLPADFQRRFDTEPAGLVEELQAAGKLIWFPCDANGEHSLGLFVDEPVPDGLLNYCTLAGKVETLQVAGGGWFGGMEAMFRDDRSYLDRHPRKCSAVQIPAGEYFAEVFT